MRNKNCKIGRYIAESSSEWASTDTTSNYRLWFYLFLLYLFLDGGMLIHYEEVLVLVGTSGLSGRVKKDRNDIWGLKWLTLFLRNSVWINIWNFEVWV